MSKKIPVLLVTGIAVIAVNANAGEKGKANEMFKVYGQARVSIDNQSTDFGPGKKGTSIVSNASRIGAKGKFKTNLEGTAAIYQLEFRYETTDSTNGTAGKSVEFREGYAGLVNKQWGRLRAGRLSVPYKTTLTKIDPWNDNIPQSRAGGRQGTSELHSSYFNNAIEYMTPKFAGGFTAGLWYASEFDGSAKPLHNTGTLKNYTGGNAAGVGVKYVAGPIRLGLDYIDISADAITKANLENGSGWQIGGRYKFGKQFSVAAMYEDVEDLGLGKNSYINGIYKFGQTRYILGYGQNRDGAVYGNKDWNNLSLGLKRAIGHKSEIFLAYNTRQDDTGGKDFNSVTGGFNIKFGY